MDLKQLEKEILIKRPSVKKELKYDLGFQMGQVLFEARLMKGLTQKRLAELANTKQPSIARIESGRSLPSLGFLEKLAKAMKTYLVPPKFGFMEATQYDLRSSNSAENFTKYLIPSSTILPIVMSYSLNTQTYTI